MEPTPEEDEEDDEMEMALEIALDGLAPPKNAAQGMEAMTTRLASLNRTKAALLARDEMPDEQLRQEITGAQAQLEAYTRLHEGRN